MKASHYSGILLMVIFLVVSCAPQAMPPSNSPKLEPSLDADSGLPAIPESASLAGLELIYIESGDPGFQNLRLVIEENLFPEETTQDMAAALHAIASLRAEIQLQEEPRVEDVQVAAWSICFPVPGKIALRPSEYAMWEQVRPQITSGASTRPSVYWGISGRISTDFLSRPLDDIRQIVNEESVYSYWDLRDYQ